MLVFEGHGLLQPHADVRGVSVLVDQEPKLLDEGSPVPVFSIKAEIFNFAHSALQTGGERREAGRVDTEARVKGKINCKQKV